VFVLPLKVQEVKQAVQQSPEPCSINSGPSAQQGADSPTCSNSREPLYPPRAAVRSPLKIIHWTVFRAFRLLDHFGHIDLSSPAVVPLWLSQQKPFISKELPSFMGQQDEKNLLRAKYVCLRVCGSIHIQILILYSICCPIVPGKPEALVAESFRAWDNLQDRRRDRAKSFQPVPYIDPLPPVNGERRPVGCFPLAQHPDYKDKYSIAASRKIQRFRRNPSERESPFFRSWCILCFCRKNMIY